MSSSAVDASVFQALLRPEPFPQIFDVFVNEDLKHFDNDRTSLSDNYYNFYANYGAVFKPQSILEIGVRRGYSAYALIRGAKGATKRFVGLDFEEEESNFNSDARLLLAALGVQSFDILKIDTQRSFPQLAETFSLIHVDADHSMRGALTDLANSHQFLSEGGVIVVDDYSSPPVAAAVEAFLSISDLDARAFGIPNYRGHILIWLRGRALELALLFAQLPGWATTLLEIDDLIDAAFRLRSVAKESAIRPVAAIAGIVLGKLGRALGMEHSTIIPSNNTPGLEAMIEYAAAVASALTARSDGDSYRAATAELRRHVRYAAERSEANVAPEFIGQPELPIHRHRLDSATLGQLLWEFSFHILNFARQVSFRLFHTGRAWAG